MTLRDKATFALYLIVYIAILYVLVQANPVANILRWP